MRATVKMIKKRKTNMSKTKRKRGMPPKFLSSCVYVWRVVAVMQGACVCCYRVVLRARGGKGDTGLTHTKYYPNHHHGYGVSLRQGWSQGCTGKAVAADLGSNWVANPYYNPNQNRSPQP